MKSGAIDFYFDFISPYAYLGSQLVDALGERQGRGVDWRPLLLGISVLRVMELKAIADTPLKGTYSRHDAPRFARYLGLPFKRPHGVLKPLAPMRAFVWLKQNDPAAATLFARTFFRAQWGEGRNLSDPDAVAALAAELGHNAPAVRAAIDDEAVKQRLRTDVDAAIAAGVFGVPTLVVDGELFWGADRLPMVERWLESGGW